MKRGLGNSQWLISVVHDQFCMACQCRTRPRDSKTYLDYKVMLVRTRQRASIGKRRSMPMQEQLMSSDGFADIRKPWCETMTEMVHVQDSQR